MTPPPPAVLRATTDDQIRSTFPVIHQLRPHLDPDGYVERVRRMEQTDGYRLAYVEAGGAVTAVAGYREMDMLYCGHILSVDDLITDEAARSGGYGKALLDWLRDEAQALGCAQVHLDSGVWRDGAHRFYFREGFRIFAFHFVADT